MRVLFWDVDTQVDFFEGGKLAVPGADTVRRNLRELTLSGQGLGAIMTGSVDAHTTRDPEFRVWGEHCVYGTPGQRKIPETRLPELLFVPSKSLTGNQLRGAGDFQGQVVFEKQINDVKSNRNVARFLEYVEPEEIVLYGVVTEVCVDLAIRFLRGDLGYGVTVIMDAIREIDAKKAEDVQSNWREMGAKSDTLASCLARLGKAASPGASQPRRGLP